MIRIFFFSLLLVLACRVSAQTGREVSGVVQDTTGTGISGASVKLTSAKDSLTAHTNSDGVFVFKNVRLSQFSISVTSLGFQSVTIRSLNAEGTSRIVLNPPIKLKPGASMLEEVEINGTPAVRIAQDTIEYRASDFKLKQGAVLEDLVKRLDGVEVDKEGNVTAQGKSVTRVRMDGKDFFGGDLKTATKNIPVDAIDKIQLIDDYGDQANFTGVREGEPETIINITTRPGRNKGVIANATAGGGSQDRYQFSTFASRFKGERNMGITANLNNNGTTIGGGGFGGRGGAGGNFGGPNGAGGGGARGFSGGGDAGGNTGGGITTQSNLGLNYTNRLSKKVVVTAAYSFTYNNSSVLRNSYQVSTNNIYSNSNINNGSNRNSHGFNGRLVYNINKSNLLTIVPSFTYGKNDAENITLSSDSGAIRQYQRNVSSSSASTPFFSTNILYNHLFKKLGRNSSLQINFNNNNQSSGSRVDNHVLVYSPADTARLIKDELTYRDNATENRRFSGSGSLVYNEPLNKKGRIQFTYSLTYSNYDNSRIVSNISSGILAPVDSLSNIFQYSATQNRLGVNYNFRSTRSELALGLTGISALLSGESESLNTVIHRSQLYVAPILRYTYRYSRTRAITVNYTANSTEPQFAQLQPVRDVTNPRRPVAGNPDLKNSFTHTLRTSYNNSNPAKHSSFMISLNGSVMNDQIVTNVVILPDYRTEIRYLNSDGAYSYNTNYSWQKAFKDRQYTVRLNGDIGYSRNVSFENGSKNFSGRWSFSPRAGLQINPGSWLELTPTFVYRYTNTSYTLAKNTDTKIQNYSFDVDGTFYLLKSRSLLMNFSASQNFISGYNSSNANTNPLIINSAIEKRFLKNQSVILKLQAFDIFNQTNNITQNLSANGFTESSTNRLTQYLMLAASIRFNKFAGGPGGGGGPGRGAGGGFGRPGGGGGFGGGGQRNGR